MSYKAPILRNQDQREQTMKLIQQKQIEANIAKLMAETAKLNTETESLRFRDLMEIIKIFIYGALTSAGMITAINQLMTTPKP